MTLFIIVFIVTVYAACGILVGIQHYKKEIDDYCKKIARLNHNRYISNYEVSKVEDIPFAQEKITATFVGLGWPMYLIVVGIRNVHNSRRVNRDRKYEMRVAELRMQRDQ